MGTLCGAKQRAKLISKDNRNKPKNIFVISKGYREHGLFVEDRGYYARIKLNPNGKTKGPENINKSIFDLKLTIRERVDRMKVKKEICIILVFLRGSESDLWV